MQNVIAIVIIPIVAGKIDVKPTSNSMHRGNSKYRIQSENVEQMDKLKLQSKKCVACLCLSQAAHDFSYGISHSEDEYKVYA